VETKKTRVVALDGEGTSPEFVFWYDLHENGCVVKFAVHQVEVHAPWMTTLARGSVKWDACMDVTIGEGCMLHNCGPGLDEIDRLKKILAHVYADAREVLGEACDSAGYW